MIKLTFTVIFVLILQLTFAQVSINGKITNDTQKPLQFVTVSLLQNNNKVSLAISDSNGNYQFKKVVEGIYALNYKFIAYKDTTVKVAVNADTTINVQLRRSSQLLSEVVIKAQKPVFERQIDRFRFNVGQTDLVQGNNVWDILEKTPLVQATEDGAIAISGNSGAVVYINNKKKVLSGSALKSYLSGLPSDNLEAIEVITTPPSRYEAEGGAGIINIVTKKNKEEGLIGSASLSTRQTAVNSEAGSLYLNERSGKWNLYSTVYMGNRSRKPLTNRDILYPESFAGAVMERNISSVNRYTELYPGASFGTDYQLSANHVIGMLLDFSGNIHKETRNALTRDFYPVTDSLTQTVNQDQINSQTYALNMNYQGKLDATGKILSVDYDALAYRSGNTSNSTNTELNPFTGGTINDLDIFRTTSPQHINNQSIKADIDWPLRDKKGTLSFGGKASFSKINNTFLFENLANGAIWIADAHQSNQFLYQENINALYGNFNYKLNTVWSYQVGLRLENTIAKGWLENNEVVSRNYTNLFPTAFLKLATKTEGAYVLAVTSRITRPGYWDLNPFRTYTTDKAYFAGNPLLKPVKYYREELSHSLNEQWGTLTFQLAGTQIIGEIYSLPYNLGDTIINQKTNYGNRYSHSLTASYNNQFKPWWRFSGTALVNYVLTKGTYANNIAINNQTVALTLSTNQTFTISKKAGLTSTLILNNSFPGTIVNTRIGNRLETEIRLRKTTGPFGISLSAQDWFKSNKDRFDYTLGALHVKDSYYNDTRSIALALSYNFGKQSVKDKRDRDTGSQDVKGRLI
ncbi:outer membrane receptor protein involved in Fe transport [Mucilaginibacter gracilis]|uniref:Outer membrane receptor protein involved in Fe transport n=1 Tax=Mucilaginibacter gracilis TaxID=423350 RepID=A0A495J3J2_9SPHI|nr:outer membrane beta-barrel protein [Mucilaginibacter gracilis]RKR82924.1 outer membrane receptor protein involved in Fe transport [Mucilaginibacter gracilis]